MARLRTRKEKRERSNLLIPNSVSSSFRFDIVERESRVRRSDVRILEYIKTCENFNHAVCIVRSHATLCLDSCATTTTIVPSVFNNIPGSGAMALYRSDLSAFIQPPSSLNIVPRVNSFQFPVVAAFGRYLPSILNLHEDRKITTLGGYTVPTSPSVDDFPL